MTQKNEILNHLVSGNTLTSLQAFELFGCTRLAATIHRLRKEGHPISSETFSVKNRYDQSTNIVRYCYKGQENVGMTDAESIITQINEVQVSVL